MTRRELLIAGTVAALLPLQALAQQSGVPRVGFLILGNPEPYYRFLTEALRDAGQLTKFELVIDQKTVRAVGIKVPQTVLPRADRAIA